MNFKTTYILFGLLAGLLAVLALNQLLGIQSPKDQSAWVFPKLNGGKNVIRANDIDTVEIERTGAKPVKLLFYRGAQGWRSKEPSVRLDGFAVDRLINQVVQAKKDEKADLTSDLNRFGLDSPPTVVTLKKSGGDQEWKLNIGNESVTGTEFEKLVYVTTSDQPKEPMAVRRSELDTVFKDLNDFRSKSLLADSAIDMTVVKLQEPKREEVSLEKTSDSHWRFAKPAFGDADYEGEPAAPGAASTTPQRITGVQGLLQAVADLRVDSNEDFGDIGVSDADLAAKGVEKGKERLRIEVKRQSSLGGDEKKEPVEETLLIGNKADDKGEKFYARLESEKNLVKIPAKKVEAITRVVEDPSAIRNKDLVQFESGKVDAIDIQPSERTAFKLRKAGEPAEWKIYVAGAPQKAESGPVQDLLSAVTAKRQIKDFPDSSKTDAALGLDKPAGVVSLWVDAIKKEEKKDGDKKEEKKDTKAEAAKNEPKKDANALPALKEEKPTVKLVLGRREKDLVYVRREAGTEVARVGVPATLLDKASEGKLAYLDRTLPSFSTNKDIRKVVLTRGGETYEVNRIKDDKWQLKQPKGLAGRSADAGKVDQLLNDLHDLRAEKLVAEKATDKELDGYGLKSPAIKVALAHDKDDKKSAAKVFAYLFGKETDDKAGYYAKQGDRDFIFVVRKGVLGPLQGDLQDPTLFSFEPNKVKSVKFSGWQDISGSPFVLELERKSSQEWLAKNPPGFRVNSVQAENFVGGLANLKAVRFLPGIAGKPEYKLDLKDSALDVVITLDGEKEPYILTIGGPSGTEGYYARSNKLPNQLFVLPKGSFEQAKAKPAYFVKND
jgi:hypothetical protein